MGEVPTGAYKPLPNLKRYTSRKGWKFSILVLRSPYGLCLSGKSKEYLETNAAFRAAPKMTAKDDGYAGRPNARTFQAQ